MRSSTPTSSPKLVIIVPHGFEPNYTLGFVKGLAANGLVPLVISSDNDHLRLLQTGIRSINLRGSQDAGRPTARKVAELAKYYARLLFFLWDHRGAIVHFTGIFRDSRTFFEGIVLGVGFRLLSSRYIYTAHNVLPHNKESSWFYKRFYNVLYRIPHIILVHTTRAKDQIVAQFGVPEQKIIVISIGLNEEVPITTLTRVEARKRLGFSEQERVILFFGKADLYKGLDTLLEAFDQVDLPSTKLLISCWFPDSKYRARILTALDSARRRPDIHLHEGFTPNEEVEVFFKSADLLVLPYRNIYQSGVVFLAFQFGLPLVATDVGSLRDYVEEEMGIITESNDARGVAEGIRLFFEQQDRFKRDRIAEKGREYRWDSICQALVPIYR